MVPSRPAAPLVCVLPVSTTFTLALALVRCPHPLPVSVGRQRRIEPTTSAPKGCDDRSTESVGSNIDDVAHFSPGIHSQEYSSGSVDAWVRFVSPLTCNSNGSFSVECCHIRHVLELLKEKHPT